MPSLWWSKRKHIKRNREISELVVTEMRRFAADIAVAIHNASEAACYFSLDAAAPLPTMYETQLRVWHMAGTVQVR